MGVKIRERKPGEWWLFIDHKGQRKAVKVGSKQAAKTKAAELEGMLVNGKLNLEDAKEQAPITFKKATDRWMAEHVNLKLKPSGQAYYRGILSRRLAPEFGSRELSFITRADIKGVVARWATEKSGVRSIPNALRTLRTIFAWAIEEGLVQVNPCTDPSKIFKVDAPYSGDFLRPDEVVPYLDAVHDRFPRYHAFFRLLIFSGIRLGECIAIGWQDVDYNGRFIEVRQSSWQGNITTPKSGVSRRVNLSGSMMDSLRDHRRMMSAEALKAGRPLSGRVFVNEAGQPVDESKIRKAHFTALKRAGLRHLRVHSLRKTYGSLMVSAGVPLFHVSKLLGHSDMATTERYYAALAPGVMRDAPDVLERYITEKSATPAQPEGSLPMLVDMTPQGNA